MPQRKSREGLPEAVRSSLPEHARGFYVEARDNAFDQYKDPRKSCGHSLVEAAHQVAWAAVKREYEKNSKGDLVKRKR